jgi:hypothetical protein
VGLSECSFGLFSRLPATPVQRNVTEKKKKAMQHWSIFIKKLYTLFGHI